MDFFFRDLVGHVCPWINSLNKRNNENKIQSSPPAHVNQGMTQKLRQKTLQSSNSGSGDEEIQKQIKKYTRQLALEECAMEDQIRRWVFIDHMRIAFPCLRRNPQILWPSLKVWIEFCHFFIKTYKFRCHCVQKFIIPASLPSLLWAVFVLWVRFNLLSITIDL